MDKSMIKTLSVVFAVLLLVSIGLCVYDISINQAGFVNALMPIALAVTAAFGVYYVLAGCKKGEGSVYYKWYVIIFAVTQLINMLTHQDMTTIAVIGVAAAFGALTVLAFALNPGLKKSVILALVIVVVMLVQIFLPEAGQSVAYVTIRKAVSWMLAVTMLFMVCAKYADKQARGSK